MSFDEYNIELGGQAVMVSLVCDNFEGHSTTTETEQSLNELKELLNTLGLNPGKAYIQNRSKLLLKNDGFFVMWCF